MTLAECIEKFGSITGNTWPREAEFCSSMAIPPEIKMFGITGLVQKRIYGNDLIMAPLQRAFANVIRQGLEKELKTFDGCLMVRDVRGVPGEPSCHSYGLAIDINAAWNPLGGPSTLSEGLVKCFTDAGFTWGGTFTRHDPMHFTLGW